MVVAPIGLVTTAWAVPSELDVLRHACLTSNLGQVWSWGSSRYPLVRTFQGPAAVAVTGYDLEQIHVRVESRVGGEVEVVGRAIDLAFMELASLCLSVPLHVAANARLTVHTLTFNEPGKSAVVTCRGRSNVECTIVYSEP